MRTVEEARETVLEQARARRLPARPVPRAVAAGLVLAEPITADRDAPPFAKSVVDGYAIRAADLANGPTFALGETILAGSVPSRPLAAGETAAIMTGAPIPEGADMIVMVENAERQGASVRLDDRPEPGRNILARGREMRRGETVLEPGVVLNGPRLGLIASVGRGEILCVPRPTVAVVPTGDELVEPEQEPGPGRIRNSNAPTLTALAASAGAVARSLPIVPDRADALETALGAALGSDVVIVSGGVSAGAKDLVPAALAALGVEPLFHKVRVKPGKPLWFGLAPPRPDGRAGALVFGLPGNPVSSVVSLTLFVRPALAILAGQTAPPVHDGFYPLARAFSHRGDRPTYQPSRLVTEEGETRIEPLDWAGSADLRTVALADGFAAFPAGDVDYPPGHRLPFVRLP